jgi:hypothetical protein
MINLDQLTMPVMNSMYESGHPYFLVGAPGGGKTSRVTWYCEQAGMGIVSLCLANLDSLDARGALIPQKGAPGERPVSRFSVSAVIDMIKRTGKDKGILFLDEFLLGDLQVQKAFGPTLSERMLGEDALPPGWVVWLAGNRVSDKAGVGKMLGHLRNRVCTLYIRTTPDGYTSWAIDHGVHPLIIAFARKFPESVFSTEAPSKPDEPFCSARSLTYANDFLKLGAVGNHLPSDEVSQAVVEGFVGKAVSAQMFSFFKVADEMADIEDIIADPMTAKVPAAGRVDAQHATVQMVIHHATSETIEPLFQYVERLNKELQTTAVIRLMEKSGGTLLNSPSITQWISENRALIMATTAN